MMYTNYLQPIADSVAKNLVTNSKNFQFSTRRTRILMGFVISTIFLPGTNRKSLGQNSGSLIVFEVISGIFAILSAIGCTIIGIYYLRCYMYCIQKCFTISIICVMQRNFPPSLSYLMYRHFFTILSTLLNVPYIMLLNVLF